MTWSHGNRVDSVTYLCHKKNRSYIWNPYKNKKHSPALETGICHGLQWISGIIGQTWVKVFATRSFGKYLHKKTRNKKENSFVLLQVKNTKKIKRDFFSTEFLLSITDHSYIDHLKYLHLIFFKPLLRGEASKSEVKVTQLHFHTRSEPIQSHLKYSQNRFTLLTTGMLHCKMKLAWDSSFF